MTNFLKTFIILTIGFILVVFTLSCNNSTEHSHHNEVIDHNHEHTNHVTLNNGDKWQANPETNEGISRMEAIIQDELSANEEINCKQVKEKLLVEYNYIIKECTMTGEAHDQLHNYLLPLSDYFKELDTVDQATCKNTMDKIGNYIADYNNYFN